MATAVVYWGFSLLKSGNSTSTERSSSAEETQLTKNFPDFLNRWFITVFTKACKPVFPRISPHSLF